MGRAVWYLVGPELVWVLTCLGSWWAGAQNHPATEAGSRRVENLLWWVPALAVVVAFLTLAVPVPGSRWWVYLRATLAALPGIGIAVSILCSHIDYGDSRNSGLMAAWIMGVMFGVFALAVVMVAAALALWLGPKLMRG